MQPRNVTFLLLVTKWIGPYALDLGRHLSSGPGKLPTHSSRQIDHLNASAIEADLIQQLMHALHSLAGDQITYQVMTITFQSNGDQYTVSAILKGPKGVQYVEPTRARQLDHFDGRRVFETKAAGQVSSRVSAVTATESNDVGFPRGAL